MGKRLEGCNATLENRSRLHIETKQAGPMQLPLALHKPLTTCRLVNLEQFSEVLVVVGGTVSCCDILD